MPFTISKEWSFSASHVLDGLTPDHPCGRLHGHNYRVRVTVSAMTLDERGFVVDYGDLAPIGRFIDDRLDHRHLNDVWPAANPTAENMAYLLHGEATAVLDLIEPPPPRYWLRVGVSETPKTWAWYS